MKISDASLLAYTKFKTRRFRSILTVIGSTFLLAIMLFITLAGTGLKNSVAGKTTNPLAEYHLTSEYPTNQNIDATKVESKSAIEDFKKTINQKGFYPEGVYLSYFSDMFGPDNASLTDFNPSELAGNNFYAPGADYTSQALLKSYDDKKLIENWKPGQPIPVLVNTRFLLKKHESDFKDLKNAKERVAKLFELREQYLAKPQKFKLSINQQIKNPDGSTEVRAENAKEIELDSVIAGFTPSNDSFFANLNGGMIGGSLSIPLEIAEQVPQLSENLIVPTTYYVAHKANLERLRYIESTKQNNEYNGVAIFGDVSGSVSEFVAGIKGAFKVVIIMMLLFVTLPTMGTLSKVLADSKRETGVFRAVGANNRDITQVYATYSFFMATLAFVMAFILASVICIVLTLNKGPILSASLTEFSGSAYLVPVRFFGINLAHILFLYGLLVASALLGAALPVMRTLKKDPIMAMRDE